MPFNLGHLHRCGIGIHCALGPPDGLTHGTPDPDDPGGLRLSLPANRLAGGADDDDPTRPRTPPVISAWVIAGRRHRPPTGARYLNPASTTPPARPVRQITLGTSDDAGGVAWRQAGTGTPRTRRPSGTRAAPATSPSRPSRPANPNACSGFLDPLDGIDSGDRISYQSLRLVHWTPPRPADRRTPQDGWTTAPRRAARPS